MDLALQRPFGNPYQKPGLIIEPEHAGVKQACDMKSFAAG